MNLENLNLVELNAQEVQEVEGGRARSSWIDFLISSAIDNWGDIKKGFSDGYNMR